MWGFGTRRGRAKPSKYSDNGVSNDTLPAAAAPSIAAAPEPIVAVAAEPQPAEPARSSYAKKPFLAPTDLELTDVGPKNVLLIGACFLFEWGEALKRLGHSDLAVDRILFYLAAQLPASPPRPIETYDVQLIQIPLPSVVPDHEYFRLPADDPQAYEEVLDRSVQRLDLFLKEGLVWSDRVPAFVMSYLAPQQNLLGRLLPRYDIRNPIHFVERLNMEMDTLLKQYPNVHLIDTNHIASVYGRRFIQEDGFWNQYHGGLISFADEMWDGGRRLEKSPPVAEVHGAEIDGFVDMAWREIRAAYRTLKRADEIKMVCVDLDDTLWRGLIGEMNEAELTELGGMMSVGWPRGLAEVLQYLKRRGVILAVISKNDEAHVRAHWNKIYDAGMLRLEDFAIVKINWKAKAENVAEAIAEANVLPKSVVFLDDNPVERAAVKAAFPDIRVIETSHFRWGRVLAWSPELQVANISAESARRTEMIRGQVERQRARATLTREDFLASLGLKISIHAVRGREDERFARAFELINKTNQFNTTGVRWSDSDTTDFFAGGGVLWTFAAADRYTHYGIVGVVCMKGNEIAQFVMSCRVAGLDVELAALSAVLGQCEAPDATFEGAIRPTENNAVTRDIFQRLGWAEADGRWRGKVPPAAPPHIELRETL